MAVPSEGEYGVDKGLWYSYPVLCEGDGEYQIVEGLPISKFSAERMDITRKELIAERDALTLD